jgi:glycosyltransferase involved in cell wall biosynthesis
VKICYVVGHFSPHIGGVENLFMDIATGMKEKGHEVRVITSNSGGINGHSIQNGIDVYHCNWKIMFGHPICKTKDLKEHIKWADLIHTTTFTTANPTRRVCKKYKKPCIISIHEVLGDKWFWIEKNVFKAIGFRIFEKYVCCKPYNYIHVISDATKNDYFKYYKEINNIARIYPSVENERIQKLSVESQVGISDIFELKENCKTFLYFGRPGQPKGIFVYLESIKELTKRYSREDLKDYKFCFIISNDPLRQRLKFVNDVKRYNLNDIILISNSLPRADLFKIIKDSDYVVIPSITEGFGFTTAESCMLDKKIICSDGGSLPEVANGEVLFFENRNSKDLAEKLGKVIAEQEQAFQKIPKKLFEKSEMITKMEQVYNGILTK